MVHRKRQFNDAKRSRIEAIRYVICMQRPTGAASSALGGNVGLQAIYRAVHRLSFLRTAAGDGQKVKERANGSSGGLRVSSVGYDTRTP